MRLHKLCRIVREWVRDAAQWSGENAWPFVPASQYGFAISHAGYYREQLIRTRSELRELEIAASRTASERQQEHEADVALVTELNLQAAEDRKSLHDVRNQLQTHMFRVNELTDERDRLRRQLVEEQAQTARLGELLRQINETSNHKNLRSDLNVIKELLT